MGDDFTRHEFCADCSHADDYCYAGSIISSWVFYVRYHGECPCKNGGPLNDPARRPEDAALPIDCPPDGTTITIHGELPGLNEYTAACRTNPLKGHRMKHDAEAMILPQLAGVPPVVGPVRVACEWHTKDRRCDPDNIAFAKKYLLDAMVTAGVLAGDGRRHIVGFSDEFAVSKSDPRVVVMLLEVGE